MKNFSDFWQKVSEINACTRKEYARKKAERDDPLRGIKLFFKNYPVVEAMGPLDHNGRMQHAFAREKERYERRKRMAPQQ